MSETAPNLQDSAGEDLASQIESLLGNSSTPAEPPALRSEKNELGAQVEQMLEDAIDKVNQIAQEVPAAAPPARQPVDERTLEAELTALAEQLTSGGDAPGSKQVVDPTPARAESPHEMAPEAVAPVPPPSASAPAAPASSPVDAAPVAVPVAASVATPVQHSHPAPSPTHRPPVAAPAPTPTHGARAAKEPPAPTVEVKPRIDVRAVVRNSACRVLGVCGRALAWPLARQKPIVRDSVGWVAMVTVFMGACMWAAVLLRDPQPYVPDSPPVSLVTEGGGDGHGGGHDSGHGAKPAAKGSHAGGGDHGAAKADSHGKKDDGHGASAAPAPVKREPLIQRGAAKKPAKDAKKDGGHGGGH